MSMHNDFEMMGTGLIGPYLEYLPENRDVALGGTWYNSGSAQADYFNMTHGHFYYAPNDITAHWWEAEYYTDESFAAIEEGSNRIDTPQWDELWQLLGGGPERSWTAACRIGNRYHVGDYGQYIQATINFTNAEYEEVGGNPSTIPASIDRIYPYYLVYTGDGSRIAQSNVFWQNRGGTIGVDVYDPSAEEGNEWGWQNTVIIISWNISVTRSGKAWINRTPVNLGFGFEDNTFGEDYSSSGYSGVPDTEEEFNATWNASAPYPNRYAVDDAWSPPNNTVDATFVYMEGQITQGEDSLPVQDDEQGLTHMAFWRGTPTQDDVNAIVAKWT